MLAARLAQSRREAGDPRRRPGRDRRGARLLPRSHRARAAGRRCARGTTATSTRRRASPSAASSWATRPPATAPPSAAAPTSPVPARPDPHRAGPAGRGRGALPAPRSGISGLRRAAAAARLAARPRRRSRRGLHAARGRAAERALLLATALYEAGRSGRGRGGLPRRARRQPGQRRRAHRSRRDAARPARLRGGGRGGAAGARRLAARRRGRVGAELFARAAAGDAPSSPPRSDRARRAASPRRRRSSTARGWRCSPAGRRPPAPHRGGAHGVHRPRSAPAGAGVRCVRYAPVSPSGSRRPGRAPRGAGTHVLPPRLPRVGRRGVARRRAGGARGPRLVGLAQVAVARGIEEAPELAAEAAGSTPEACPRRGWSRRSPPARSSPEMLTGAPKDRRPRPMTRLETGQRMEPGRQNDMVDGSRPSRDANGGLAQAPRAGARRRAASRPAR